MNYVIHNAIKQIGTEYCIGCYMCYWEE